MVSRTTILTSKCSHEQLSTRRLGATRVTDEHMFKEPNPSFRTANLPSGRSKKWPTLITEEGHLPSRMWLSQAAQECHPGSSRHFAVGSLTNCYSDENKIPLYILESVHYEDQLPGRVSLLWEQQIQSAFLQIYALRYRKTQDLEQFGGSLPRIKKQSRQLSSFGHSKDTTG